jgi:hypothetical protein
MRISQSKRSIPTKKIFRVFDSKLPPVKRLVFKAVIDRHNRLWIPMILLKKETVHHPLEYLGFAHATLAQKDCRHRPTSYGINGCIIKIFQMFLTVRIHLTGNKRPDCPSGICSFVRKIVFISSPKQILKKKRLPKIRKSLLHKDKITLTWNNRKVHTHIS